MNGGLQTSDEALLRRAMRGERQAFDEIVQRHKGAIYAFIRRYIGDGDDAYDVLQETFLSAWLGLKRFDPARPFLPWLRTIAINKCRDFGRRASVRRLLLRLKSQEPEENVEEPAIASEEDARLRNLDRAILSLPPFYREPLLLTTVSGLSHAETAEILKTSPKAVEMRLRRARKQIASLLGDSGEG